MIVASRIGVIALLTACGGSGDAPEPSQRERPIGTAGAHEHAVARINVAVEGSTAQVEFMAPADGVWGFEHAARSPEEEAAMAAGRQVLVDRIADMLEFAPAAECRVTSADVMGVGEGHAHDPEHHADGSDHAMHDSDSAAGSMHAQEHGDHGEVHGMFTFTCARPRAGTTLRLAVASVFPSFRDVDLVVISETGQSGRRVAANGGSATL